MDYVAYKHLSISPIGQMVFPCTYRSAVIFDYCCNSIHSPTHLTKQHSPRLWSAVRVGEIPSNNRVLMGIGGHVEGTTEIIITKIV